MNIIPAHRLLCIALAAAGAVPLAGCVTSEYVGEQIKASEERQSAIDKAQDEAVAKLDGKFAEAFERINTTLAIRESGIKLTGVANTVMISFGRNSARISDQDQTKLAELAVALLASGDEFHLEIQGHTDSTGSPRANVEVGARRADAVRLMLHEKGVPLQKMSTISFGDTLPLVTGDAAAAHVSNRRVEIIVFK